MILCYSFEMSVMIAVDNMQWYTMYYNGWNCFFWWNTNIQSFHRNYTNITNENEFRFKHAFDSTLYSWVKYCHNIVLFHFIFPCIISTKWNSNRIPLNLLLDYDSWKKLTKTLNRYRLTISINSSCNDDY